MSTRCDFYAGRGLTAVYLGSIGHDAFLDELAGYFTEVTTREQFDAGLARVFEAYGEIRAKDGWPWPWADSGTTDNVVAFAEGRVWACHPDNHWAPLDDFDNPGPLECVFPNMRASDEATPEGRLRLALRHRASLPVGPDADLLSHLILRATSLIAMQTLHVFERDGEFWVPEFLWTHRAAAPDLWLLVETLNASGAEFLTLLAERRNAFDEEEWDLLNWVLLMPAHSTGEGVDLIVTSEQPVYFGQPIPLEWENEYGKPFPFVKLPDPAYWREGFRLLNLVLDRAPTCFAYAIVRQLEDLGVYEDRDNTNTWLKTPRPELGGVSVEDASESLAGRELVRKFACALAFPA